MRLYNLNRILQKIFNFQQLKNLNFRRLKIYEKLCKTNNLTVIFVKNDYINLLMRKVFF